MWLEGLCEIRQQDTGLDRGQILILGTLVLKTLCLCRQPYTQGSGTSETAHVGGELASALCAYVQYFRALSSQDQYTGNSMPHVCL